MAENTSVAQSCRGRSLGPCPIANRPYEADASQSVAVLCSTGETFCAGYDLKFAAEGNLDEIYDPEGRGASWRVSRMLLGKPVIAAVEGYAVAGGLELALWCDLRYVVGCHQCEYVRH